MGAMKRIALLLSVLLTLAGTAPASAAFLGAKGAAGRKSPEHWQVAGDVSREGLSGPRGAWLRAMSEFLLPQHMRLFAEQSR